MYFGKQITKLSKYYKVFSYTLKKLLHCSRHLENREDGALSYARYSFQKAPSVFGSVTPVRLDRHLENKSPI